MVKPEYLIPSFGGGRGHRRTPAVKHANIEITMDTDLTHDEIVDRVGAMLEQAEDDYGLEGFWDADHYNYNFSGKGITGEAHIDDGSVVIEIKTSAFLGAFAGRIKRELTERLEEALEE
jgi:putative polyhydroxyalkanoate system protein